MENAVGYQRKDGSWFLNAYYYGFEETGCDATDAILSAVAMAGKRFHMTQDWDDEAIEEIQRAAKQAADRIAELEKALEAKGTRVGEKEMGQRLDELEKDRERLDWLDATDYEGEARLTLIERSWWTGLQSVRAAIDAAMSEDQRGEGVEIGPRVEVSDNRDEWEKGPGR